MIVYPALPSGHTIFCDDIRHEVTGKVTFVGTYTNFLYIIGTLPVALPKLCLGVVYREEKESLEPITIKVFMPGEGDDDQPAIEARMEPQAEFLPPPTEEFTFREARMFFEIPNVIIEQEGRIRVRAYRGDDEIRLGALTVELNSNLVVPTTEASTGAP
jgi:hypothetical protein